MKREKDVIKKSVGRSVNVKAAADRWISLPDFLKMACDDQSYSNTMHLPAFVRNRPIRNENLKMVPCDIPLL